MLSFLGAALFFKPFVPNYSEIASELNKMMHKDFNWKRESWVRLRKRLREGEECTFRICVDSLFPL